MLRSVGLLNLSLCVSGATHIALAMAALLWSFDASSEITFQGRDKAKPLTLQATWMPPQATTPVATPTTTVSVAPSVAHPAPRAMTTTIARRPAALPTELPIAHRDQSASNTALGEQPERRQPQRTESQADSPPQQSPIERARRKMQPAVVQVQPERLGTDDKSPPNFSVTRQPAYPAESRRLGHEGDVVLRVSVNAKGRVIQAEVVETSGDAAIDEAARAAVLVWRGRPAMQNGQAVETTVRLRFQFRIPR